MMVMRPLTEREREVMELLAGGMSIKQVQARLGIKYHTVQVHINNVKSKARIAGPVHRLVLWFTDNKQEGGMIEPALTPEEWAKGSTSYDGICPELRGDTIMLDGLSCEGRERHAVAALCLHNQPFGFSWDDVRMLRVFAKRFREESGSDIIADGLESDELADRIASLLPPEQDEPPVSVKLTAVVSTPSFWAAGSSMRVKATCDCSRHCRIVSITPPKVECVTCGKPWEILPPETNIVLV